MENSDSSKQELLYENNLGKSDFYIDTRKDSAAQTNKYKLQNIQSQTSLSHVLTENSKTIARLIHLNIAKIIDDFQKYELAERDNFVFFTDSVRYVESVFTDQKECKKSKSADFFVEKFYYSRISLVQFTLSINLTVYQRILDLFDLINKKKPIAENVTLGAVVDYMNGNMSEKVVIEKNDSERYSINHVNPNIFFDENACRITQCENYGKLEIIDFKLLINGLKSAYESYKDKNKNKNVKGMIVNFRDFLFDSQSILVNKLIENNDESLWNVSVNCEKFLLNDTRFVRQFTESMQIN